MARLRNAALLLLGLSPGTVFADGVIRWTDAQGETHYTNDINSVPQEDRRRAKVMEETRARPNPRGIPSVDPEDEISFPAWKRRPVQVTRAAEAAPRVDVADAGTELSLEAQEAQWRKQFQAANARVAAAEKAVKDGEQLVKSLPEKDTYLAKDGLSTLQNGAEHEAAAAKLETSRAELVAARKAQIALERSASLEAVPLDWRR